MEPGSPLPALGAPLPALGSPLPVLGSPLPALGSPLPALVSGSPRQTGGGRQLDMQRDMDGLQAGDWAACWQAGPLTRIADRNVHRSQAERGCHRSQVTPLSTVTGHTAARVPACLCYATPLSTGHSHTAGPRLFVLTAHTAAAWLFKDYRSLAVCAEA